MSLVTKLLPMVKSQSKTCTFQYNFISRDIIACIASVEILTETDELQKKLSDNAKYFKEQLEN